MNGNNYLRIYISLQMQRALVTGGSGLVDKALDFIRASRKRSVHW